MEKLARERRRNYFIDRQFQARFIVKFCLLVIAASIVIGLLTYECNRQTTTVAFENLRVVVKTTADFILPTSLVVLVIVTFLTALATIIVTLFTSHKIAGPLYKVRTELQKMERGDFSSVIRIRQDDQLQNIASEFEKMRYGVHGALTSIKKNWRPLKAGLAEMVKDVKDEHRRQAIERHIETVDYELERFKTE